MSVLRHCRESFAAIFASLITVALTGCNSGAYRDVFQQKTAREIRILEDQLYEADYHNRVLSDQLEQCRVKAENGRSGEASAGLESKSGSAASAPKSSGAESSSGGGQKSAQPGQIDMDNGFDEADLELPSVDSGDLVEPEALTDPTPEVLPAPGLPEPPGEQDTTIPPIEPGEIIPPPAGGKEQDSQQPGRIILPDSLGALGWYP